MSRYNSYSSGYTPPTNVTNLGSLANRNFNSGYGASVGNMARNRSSSSLSTAGGNLGSASAAITASRGNLNRGSGASSIMATNLGSLRNSLGSTSPMISPRSSGGSSYQGGGSSRPITTSNFSNLNTLRPGGITGSGGGSSNRGASISNARSNLNKAFAANSLASGLRNAQSTGNYGPLISGGGGLGQSMASNAGMTSSGTAAYTKGLYGANNPGSGIGSATGPMTRLSNQISSNPVVGVSDAFQGLSRNNSPILNTVDTVFNSNIGQRVAESPIVNNPFTRYVNDAQMRSQSRPTGQRSTSTVTQGTMSAGARMADAAARRKAYEKRYPSLNQNQAETARLYSEGRSSLQSDHGKIANARKVYAANLEKYKQMQQNGTATQAHKNHMMQDRNKIMAAQNKYSDSKVGLRGMYDNQLGAEAITSMNRDMQGAQGTANRRAAQDYRKSIGMDSVADQSARDKRGRLIQTGGAIADMAGAGGTGSMIAGGINAVRNFGKDYRRANDYDRNIGGGYTRSPHSRRGVGENVGEMVTDRAEDIIYGGNPGYAVGRLASQVGDAIPNANARMAAQYVADVPNFVGNVAQEGIRQTFGDALDLVGDSRSYAPGVTERTGGKARGQRFRGNAAELIPGGRFALNPTAQSGTQVDAQTMRQKRMNNIKNSYPNAEAYARNPEGFRQSRATGASNVPTALRGAGAGQGVMNEGEYIRSQTGGNTGMVPGMILDTMGRMQPRNTPAAGAGDNLGLYRPDPYLGISQADTMAMQGDLAYLGMSPRERRQAQANKQRAAGKTPDQFRQELAAERNQLRGGMQPQFSDRERMMMMEVDALNQGIPANAQGQIPLNRRELNELNRAADGGMKGRLTRGINLLDKNTRDINRRISHQDRSAAMERYRQSNNRGEKLTMNSDGTSSVRRKSGFSGKPGFSGKTGFGGGVNLNQPTVGRRFGKSSRRY